MEKPANVQTAGILLLIGGIWSLIFSFAMTLSTLFLCVPSYTVGITGAIMSIVQGSRLIGSNSYGMGVPKATAILQILQVLQFDVVGMTMGIIALVMFNDGDTTAWLEGRSGMGHRAGFRPGYAAPGQVAGGAAAASAGYGGSAVPNAQATPGYGGAQAPAGMPGQAPSWAQPSAPPAAAPSWAGPPQAPPAVAPPSGPAGVPGSGTAAEGWKQGEPAPGYQPASWQAEKNVDVHASTEALAAVPAAEPNVKK